MKSLTTPLLYIALIGFLVTVGLNLSSKPEMGRMVFIFSCICSSLSILILYFMRTPGDNTGYPSLGIVQTRFARLGSIFVMAGLLLRFFYVPGGETMMMAGFVLILSFFFLMVFRFVTSKLSR